MREPAQTWSESKLLELLRRRYSGDAYAVMPQVRNATGWSRVTRTADALVMGLWPSRGLELEGFEFKVSRADWLKELKDPAKAEEICRFTDRWWIVVPNDEIVKTGELPSTWGLLVVKTGRLHTVTQAPKLEPQPLTRQFVAAVFRAAVAHVTDAQINEAYARGKKEGQEAGLVQGQYDAKRAFQRLEELTQVVKDFEEASGIRLNQWSGGKELGRLVNLAHRGQLIPPRQHIKELRDHAARVVGDLSKIIDEKICPHCSTVGLADDTELEVCERHRVEDTLEAWA